MSAIDYVAEALRRAGKSTERAVAEPMNVSDTPTEPADARATVRRSVPG